MNDRRQDSAFLDTNALHFLGIWIAYKREDGLIHCHQVDDRRLKKLLATKDQEMKKAIEKGLAIEQFCFKNDLRIQYSPISELELQIGLARGRVMSMLADEHAPPRMWSRIVHDEVAINDRLVGEPLAACRRDLEKTVRSLEEEDTSIIDQDRLIHQSDLWALARELGGLVYLDTCDCLIFANTLLAEAKYLITFDRHLKKITNRIYNSDDYVEVRKTLLKHIGNGRSLPQAPKMPRPISAEAA